MADWNTTLPGTATEGGETHVEDHNLLTSALQEVRDEVDALPVGLNGVAGLWAGTQAEFDALTPDPDVVYVVVEG